jgi:dihydroneopterin aldolase/2-amino-4-hydroxy-6-hydroxymethyldihydropteridine diphosphokinase
MSIKHQLYLSKMSETLEKYVLLTGSDLGDRSANISLAFRLIEQRIGTITKSSEIMESEPWGFESETRFLNQAILVETGLQPELLLAEILKIEGQIGRVRKATQWISRIIDIDILCAENLIHHSASLTIPHKHLHERDFALKPLCQLVPDWKHPLLKRSYSNLLSDIGLQTIPRP